MELLSSFALIPCNVNNAKEEDKLDGVRLLNQCRFHGNLLIKVLKSHALKRTIRHNEQNGQFFVIKASMDTYVYGIVF